MARSPIFRFFLDRRLQRLLRQAPESVRSVVPDRGRLELLARVKRMVLVGDGTLFSQVPYVTDYLATQDQTEASRAKVLGIAASLASCGSAPWSTAIREAAVVQQMALREIEVDVADTHRVLGRLDRTWYVVGDRHGMAAEEIHLGVTSQTLAQQLEAQGKSVIFLAQRQPKRLLGVCAWRSDLDQGEAGAIRSIRQLGIRTELVSAHSERMLQGMLQDSGLFDVVQSEADPQYYPEIVQEYAVPGNLVCIDGKEAGDLSSLPGAVTLSLSQEEGGCSMADVAEALAFAITRINGAQRQS